MRNEWVFLLWMINVKSKMFNDCWTWAAHEGAAGVYKERTKSSEKLLKKNLMPRADLQHRPEVLLKAVFTDCSSVVATRLTNTANVASGVDVKWVRAQKEAAWHWKLQNAPEILTDHAYMRRFWFSICFVNQLYSILKWKLSICVHNPVGLFNRLWGARLCLQQEIRAVSSHLRWRTPSPDRASSPSRSLQTAWLKETNSTFTRGSNKFMMMRHTLNIYCEII